MTRTNKNTGAVPKQTGITPKKTNDKIEHEETTDNNNQVLTLQMVKDMMKVQQDTMLVCFNQIVCNLSSKVDNIMCDVQDIKTSLNFITNNYDDKFKNLETSINYLKHDISEKQSIMLNERAYFINRTRTLDPDP